MSKDKVGFKQAFFATLGYLAAQLLILITLFIGILLVYAVFIMDWV